MPSKLELLDFAVRMMDFATIVVTTAKTKNPIPIPIKIINLLRFFTPPSLFLF